MCKYCERRQDVPFGWEQPPLPYHNQEPGSNLTGNIAAFDDFEGYIYDYKTAHAQLLLKCNGYFDGEGVGTIYIPIRYCPECGRKVGNPSEEST